MKLYLVLVSVIVIATACGLITVTVEQRVTMDKGDNTKDNYTAQHSTREENNARLTR